ncbi:hypothetical protein RclHR1_01480025 [Rhizophagus clarus]|uniref:BTB domain-containing protein n=1 Tax=Rhizophagus clarus TaxID=94130 RepID=A0A2Z6QDL9_9GLOM|nr:hypothetical protein RclHR1_01480025 [Rhizophagus clarus]GET00870.1 hypothetical protein GLOIN_2v1765555 [Rhizophagus clarus]
MAAQFLPYLSQDLTKLLDNKKNYDFIINVGNGNNGKEFCAHSIILETRSIYFEDALSNGVARKVNNNFVLDFPDISVNLFNILIRYIYGGTINIDHNEAADVLNLLIACEKLRLKELYDYIQDYLIVHHQTWLFQNFVLIQQVGFKYSEFTKLQNYWTKTVCEQPEILFNATDFTSIGKEELLSVCKDENLCTEENKLWDHIIRWGKAQNNELPEEINNWTTNDFNILKKTIDDFLPNIRFYDISSDDFYYKIMPYSMILPNEIYRELSGYHLVSNWQPKFNNFMPRKNIPTIDSKLINSEQAALISSWIQGNNDNKISNKFKKIYYEFQLVTRGSRDGFTKTIFHKKCDNKGPTITIVRLKGETSILGGYNPINWDVSKSGSWEKTSDSFIFNLDKEIILSRVQNYDNAILQNNGGPNFQDLRFMSTFNVSDGVECIKSSYNQKIHAEGNFIANEYEVFSVARKRNH